MFLKTDITTTGNDRKEDNPDVKIEEKQVPLTQDNSRKSIIFYNSSTQEFINFDFSKSCVLDLSSYDRNTILSFHTLLVVLFSGGYTDLDFKYEDNSFLNFGDLALTIGYSCDEQHKSERHLEQIDVSASVDNSYVTVSGFTTISNEKIDLKENLFSKKHNELLESAILQPLILIHGVDDDLSFRDTLSFFLDFYLGRIRMEYNEIRTKSITESRDYLKDLLKKLKFFYNEMFIDNEFEVHKFTFNLSEYTVSELVLELKNIDMLGDGDTNRYFTITLYGTPTVCRLKVLLCFFYMFEYERKTIGTTLGLNLVLNFSEYYKNIFEEFKVFVENKKENTLRDNYLFIHTAI